MKLAVGSDERTELSDFVLRELEKRGFRVETYGALRNEAVPWPGVAVQVAESVADGRCDEGVLMCWTGTGVTIAANKVPGVRAALCADAATAAGARRWNHANVLALSLRLTSVPVAGEILDAWFSASPGDGEDATNVARIAELERRYLEGRK
ncbi:MAG: RpiB/LacA/LacB family sugar-phosphate isomerase [Chloroflexota bacterium]